MKFLDVEGYLWIVSCCSHTSAGILAALPTASTRDLFSKLDAYLSEHYPHASRLERWVALVPTAQDPSLFDQACCGENWALLGDAAGHADPLLAEGIYYAFRSARLAAQALLEGDLTSYDTAWRDTYGHRLTANARRRSDAKRLLGGSSELMGYMLYRYFMEVAAYAQRT
jgi:flavin-dependent dehydrogenase